MEVVGLLLLLLKAAVCDGSGALERLAGGGGEADAE